MQGLTVTFLTLILKSEFAIPFALLILMCIAIVECDCSFISNGVVDTWKCLGP